PSDDLDIDSLVVALPDEADVLPGTFHPNRLPALERLCMCAILPEAASTCSPAIARDRICTAPMRSLGTVRACGHRGCLGQREGVGSGSWWRFGWPERRWSSRR